MKTGRILLSLSVLVCTGCVTAVPSSDDVKTEDGTCRNISYYDYGSPVPQHSASDDWFSDAIVIGDMRAGSLALYSDLASKGAEIIYEETLGVYSLKTSPIQMSSSTAYDILLKSDRKKIYLWLGLNEVAYEVSDWATAYSQAVGEIIQSHQDAQIYLIGEYQAVSVNGIDSETLASQIHAQNEAMQKIAEENRIYFIDTAEPISGNDGKIDGSYVWGGYSLNPDGAMKVSQLLFDHTVMEDDHVKKICE